jgi:hypothetical protein
MRSNSITDMNSVRASAEIKTPTKPSVPPLDPAFELQAGPATTSTKLKDVALLGGFSPVPTSDADESELLDAFSLASRSPSTPTVTNPIPLPTNLVDDLHSKVHTLESKPSSRRTPEFPFSCRCGCIGPDGSKFADGLDVVYCDRCKTWAHMACQRYGRAARLGRKKKFFCDLCAPTFGPGDIPKPPKMRYVCSNTPQSKSDWFIVRVGPGMRVHILCAYIFEYHSAWG